MTKLISVMMLSTLALAACGGGGKTDSTGSSTGGKKLVGNSFLE